ncbi:MAG: replication protein [Nitrospirota bacterium]
MASPQKEHGYTPIANELLDAFMKLNLSEHAWRVVVCIIRYSYGWHRKTVHLTCSQIARATGLDVRLIPRTVKRLCEKKVIVRITNTYELQKDYSQWRVSSPEMSSPGMKPSSAGMSSVEMKTFIRSDEEASSVEMKATAQITNNDKELPAPKERKEIIKEISLSKAGFGLPEREDICKDLKRFFPTLIVPDVVPTERAYLFLAKLRFGEIAKHEIRSPPAFLIAMRDEDVTPYLEREAQIRERQRRMQEARPQGSDSPADRETALRFLRSFREKEASI